MRRHPRIFGEKYSMATLENGKAEAHRITVAIANKLTLHFIFIKSLISYTESFYVSHNRRNL